MHKTRPEENISIVISILEELTLREIKADEEAVARNMRSYNAAG